jgi:hypothetical protein
MTGEGNGDIAWRMRTLAVYLRQKLKIEEADISAPVSETELTGNDADEYELEDAET